MRRAGSRKVRFRKRLQRRRQSRRRTTSIRRQRGGAGSPPSQPPIKIFTSADRIKPTLQALEASARRHGYAFEILGLGKPWKGFQTKMQNYLDGIRAYKASAGPDALAIFLDGFDTIVIQDASLVSKKYREKPRPMPIVVGVEYCCLSNCDPDILQWFDVHRIPGGSKAKKEGLTVDSNGVVLSPTPVFLNSGLIMGPAGHLERMFQAMMDGGNPDDQLAAAAFAKENWNLVDLDLEDSIFRNKIPNREKLPEEGTPAGPGILHFPASGDEQSQAALLKRYEQYP